MKLKFIKRNYIIYLIIFFAAVIYITTAYNSHGFYHADEHYQIIEFAGLKIGTHKPHDLAWEFRAQIRPTLQPTICFLLLKTYIFFGITNPYLQAFLLRLISALLALTIITYFVKNTEKFISNEDKIIYYILSYFLWFLPIISVRFSSETWAGILFLMALGIFNSNSGENLKTGIIGLLFGFSFLFRFQIGLAIFGFLLWLIIFNHSSFRFLLKICFSFGFTLLVGFAIDSWFYGELVFTPWKYFYKNVIEGAAAGFGTSSWYFYILKMISYPSYFIGIPLLLSFIILLISKPKHYLLWCTLPFIIGHSILPHKEERFLFPIVYLFPLILLESYTIIKKLITNRFILKVINLSLLVSLFIINSIGLFVMSQKSAGIGRMEITKYIYDNYHNKRINIISCKFSNPYDPWQSLPVKFYLEKNMIDSRISNLCDLNDSLIVKDAINLLVVRKYDLRNENCSGMVSENNFSFEIQSIPEWIEKINKKYKGFENYKILVLYKYTGEKY